METASDPGLVLDRSRRHRLGMGRGRGQGPGSCTAPPRAAVFPPSAITT
ncbi:hypothetical protein SSAG_06593 [Streptomyces sp. Mg1]|nr:hypothetical protein SSAG_06593 [Streptomyces sp. Mg1]